MAHHDFLRERRESQPWDGIGFERILPIGLLGVFVRQDRAQRLRAHGVELAVLPDPVTFRLQPRRGRQACEIDTAVELGGWVEDRLIPPLRGGVVARALWCAASSAGMCRNSSRK